MKTRWGDLAAALWCGSLAACATTDPEDGTVAKEELAAATEPAITVERPLPVDRPQALDPALVSSGAWVDGVRHGSLRAALISAPAGSRIELESGTHSGPIEISRSMELAPRLADGVVVIVSRSPVALRVRANAEVTLRDLTIRAEGPPGSGSDAAVLVQNATLRAENCRIDSRRSGGVGGLGATLELDTVTVRCELGQTGIMIADGSTGALRHCDVETGAGIGSGVEVWDSRCTLMGGRIQAATASLVAGEDSNVRADSVVLRGAGAACMPHGELDMVAAEVHLARRGVNVRGVVRLSGCRLVGNDVAVVMTGTDADLTFAGTVFSGNGQRMVYLEGAGPEQVTGGDAP
jgi:hypothetical protein